MKAMFIPRRQFLQTAIAAVPALAIPRFASAADTATSIPDIEALTSDRKEILLKGANVKDFAARLRGELLLRDSAGYDSARRLWNGAFDRYPALIARCSGPADVMEAVKFAAS